MRCAITVWVFGVHLVWLATDGSRVARGTWSTQGAPHCTHSTRPSFGLWDLGLGRYPSSYATVLLSYT